MVLNYCDVETMDDVLEIYPIISYDDFKNLYKILNKHQQIISTPIELTQIVFMSSIKEWFVKIRINYSASKALNFISFKKELQDLKNELVIFC